MLPLSDFIGYVGSTCLAMRYIPIIKDYVKTRYLPYNPYLECLELFANVMLGISGYMIGSHPMMVTNGWCFGVTIILYSHYICCGKKQQLYPLPQDEEFLVQHYGGC